LRLTAIPMLAPISISCPSTANVSLSAAIAARQKKGLLEVADCGLHDDELVAAEPDREGVVAVHAAEAARDGLEESIARGAAIPVVGSLEPVEVDAVDGDNVALVVSPPRSALEALLEA
jgi:hypothetical protein